MRIAFVTDDVYPGYGGQARATEGHVRALLALGHEVRVLAGRDAAPTEAPPGVDVRRLPVCRLGSIQTHLAIPSWRAIDRVLDWADVVHVNLPTPLGALACLRARARGVPCVLGVHTQIESSTMHFRRGAAWTARGLDLWYRFLFRVPDALTAPTAFAAKLARTRTDRPVLVVSNGIDLPAPTRADLDEAAAMRRAWGGSHLVAYVGRLSPEKAPMAMLELAARTSADVAWAVAGDGPSLADVRARCAALGIADRVHLLGFVDEQTKHRLLLAADVFVMPSPTELQSIATLEAMARGCAVLAADHPTSAVPDLVRGAGCGILYPPHGVPEAARALEALLRDPPRLERLQERARAEVACHDVRRSGVALVRLYTFLAAIAKRRR